MQKKNFILLSVLSMFLGMVGSPSPRALASPAAVAPALGAAASFVALASSTLTNTGSGVFYGNVGVSPGTEVTGFPPGTIIGGAIHIADAVADQAHTDATSAYIQLVIQTCSVNLTGQDLGGMTLQSGVYCFNTEAGLTGDLVLDALGDPQAVWVFQIGSTLTTASASTVTMINGGQAGNLFWKIGSAATLGSGTLFKGNIIADASITLNTGAGLAGRALSLNGAVTMDTNGSPMITNASLFSLFLPLIMRNTD